MNYVQISASDRYLAIGVTELVVGVVEVLPFDPVQIGTMLDPCALALFKVWAVIAITANSEIAARTNAACLNIP